jgi:hypothetical protein
LAREKITLEQVEEAIWNAERLLGRYRYQLPANNLQLTRHEKKALKAEHKLTEARNILGERR